MTESVYERLRKRGWSDVGAAGLVANAWHESSGKPGAVGDSGASSGLFQWHGPRQQALKKYAQTRGKPWDDAGVQIDFLEDELGSSFKGLKDRMNAAPTPEAAAVMFTREFERPANVDARASERAKTARTVFSMVPGAAASQGQSAPSVDGLLAKAAVTPDGLKAKVRPKPIDHAIQTVRGLGDLIQEGVTLGFADEARALGAATGQWIADRINGRDEDFGDIYDRELRTARGPAKQFMEEHPVIGTVANVAGGIATGAPVARAVVTSATTLRTTLRSILTGAGFGSAAGVGTAEGDLVETGEHAVMGGVLGGAATAVIAPIARAVSSFSQRALSRTERTAFNSVIRAFERDGVPFDEALQRLQDWQAAGAKPEILADFGGDNVRGLLRAAVSVPGQARTAAAETMVARQAQQGERVFNDALNALAPGTTPRAVTRQLMQARRAAAAPLYNQAYDENFIMTPRIAELLERPSMQKAMRRAVVIAREEGRDPATLGLIDDADGNIVNIRVPTIQTMDYVKRGLDDVLEQFRNPLTGRLQLDEAGRAINATRAEFVSHLRDNYPSYAAALDAWAGPSQMLSALDRGRRFISSFNREPDMASDVFDRMTTAEREFFRIGLAQHVQDVVEKAPDGADAVRRIFGSDRMREAMAIAMPNDTQRRMFEVAMAREANMLRTYRMSGLQSGSPTARITEEVADMTADIGITPGAALRAVTGSPQELVVQVIGRMLKDPNQAQRLKADVADAVGQVLMAGNPQQIARALGQLGAFERATISGARTQGAVSRISGVAAGRSTASVGGESDAD